MRRPTKAGKILNPESNFYVDPFGRKGRKIISQYGGSLFGYSLGQNMKLNQKLDQKPNQKQQKKVRDQTYSYNQSGGCGCDEP